MMEQHIGQNGINKGQMVYYGRVLYDTYDVYELKVLNVNEKKNYFTAITISGRKQTFLFDFSDIEKIVFINRDDALHYVLAKEEGDK